MQTVREAGTPQGGSVSPVLANIYLHYVLDLWFEKVVKSHCAGEVLMIRYADDYVCLFQYRREAERFFGVRCNFKSLQSYFREAMVILRKWLNRRSQRRSCSWEKFWNLLKVYRIERPRIVIKPIRPAQLLLPC